MTFCVEERFLIGDGFNLAGKNTVARSIGWRLEPDKFRVVISLNAEGN